MLAGAAFALRRRWAGLWRLVLPFLACCTGLLGIGIAYGCYRWAPYSMGLGAASISAGTLDRFMCLSQGALATAAMWTVIVLSCCAAVGLAAGARLPGKNVAIRASCAIGAALLLLVALAAGLLLCFSFSSCVSRRLF